VAQADDGAFEAIQEISSAGFSVRFGRSLLDAPVASLAPHREALEREGLIADFFAGRPLPRAELPTLAALETP